MLEHVRRTLSNADIAARLDISVNTVRYHVSNMLAKLSLEDRQQLAAWQPPAERRERRRLPGLGVLAGSGWLGTKGAKVLGAVGAAAAVAVGAIAIVAVLSDGLGDGPATATREPSAGASVVAEVEPERDDATGRSSRGEAQDLLEARFVEIGPFVRYRSGRLLLNDIEVRDDFVYVRVPEAATLAVRGRIA